MNEYQHRMKLAQAVAELNKVAPRVFHRDPDGSRSRPFLAKFYEAQVPRLHQQLDELYPQLDSPDASIREQARERLSAIRRQIDHIESGQG